MYEAHFQFSRRPFSATPDPACHFATARLAEQQAQVERCLDHGQGIVLIIGGGGLGKSLELLCLQNVVKNAYTPVLLHAGSLTNRRALLQTILYELGERYTGLTEEECRLELRSSLQRLANANRSAVVLIDEAEHLDIECLEELRVLSDLTSGSQTLLRLVLCGLPTLEDRLIDPALAALNQRIAVQMFLEPLSRKESEEYIRYRLNLAGAGVQELFSTEALTRIIQTCDGIPRCLNQLCDHALLLAYVADASQVARKQVDEALSDLKQLPLHWNTSIRSEDAHTGQEQTDGSELAPAEHPIHAGQAALMHAMADELSGNTLSGLESRFDGDLVGSITGGSRENLAASACTSVGHNRQPEHSALADLTPLAAAFEFGAGDESKSDSIVPATTSASSTDPSRRQQTHTDNFLQPQVVDLAPTSSHDSNWSGPNWMTGPATSALVAHDSSDLIRSDLSRSDLNGTASLTQSSAQIGIHSGVGGAASSEIISTPVEIPAGHGPIYRATASPSETEGLAGLVHPASTVSADSEMPSVDATVSTPLSGAAAIGTEESAWIAGAAVSDLSGGTPFGNVEAMESAVAVNCPRELIAQVSTDESAANPHMTRAFDEEFVPHPWPIELRHTSAQDRFVPTSKVAGSVHPCGGGGCGRETCGRHQHGQQHEQEGEQGVTGFISGVGPETKIGFIELEQGESANLIGSDAGIDSMTSATGDSLTADMETILKMLGLSSSNAGRARTAAQFAEERVFDRYAALDAGQTDLPATPRDLSSPRETNETTGRHRSRVTDQPPGQYGSGDSQPLQEGSSPGENSRALQTLDSLQNLIRLAHSGEDGSDDDSSSEEEFLQTPVSRTDRRSHETESTGRSANPPAEPREAAATTRGDQSQAEQSHGSRSNFATEESEEDRILAEVHQLADELRQVAREVAEVRRGQVPAATTVQPEQSTTGRISPATHRIDDRQSAPAPVGIARTSAAAAAEEIAPRGSGVQALNDSAIPSYKRLFSLLRKKRSPEVQ